MSDPYYSNDLAARLAEQGDKPDPLFPLPGPTIRTFRRSSSA